MISYNSVGWLEVSLKVSPGLARALHLAKVQDSLTCLSIGASCQQESLDSLPRCHSSSRTFLKGSCKATFNARKGKSCKPS